MDRIKANLSHIISTGVVLLGLAVSWGSNKTTLSYLTKSVEKIQCKVEKLEAAVIRLQVLSNSKKKVNRREYME